MKHVISAQDFRADWVQEVLERATFNIETYRSGEPKGHKSTKATVFIAEPSTRTSGSYSEAARLAGCAREGISGADLTSLVKGETLGATGRMFSGQNTALLPIRTRIEGGARWLTEMFAMEGYEYLTAVHNCGDGSNEHPTQALLDLLTIQQKLNRLTDLKIGFVGDLRNSRTVHSLVGVLRLFTGIKIVLVSSPSVKLPGWYTEGMEVEQSQEIEALRGCDVVYVTRVQAERFGGNKVEYERVRGLYSIGVKELELIGPKTQIMHPQPINQTDRDIDPRIWRHPQVVMDFQAQMGIPMRMALIEWSLAHIKDSVVSEAPKPGIAVLSERSAGEALRAKHARNQYFTPIERGTVIDHIPHGLGAKVEAVSNAEANNGDGAVLLLKRLRTQGDPGTKDVLVIEDGFLSDAEKAAISVIAPSAVFNEIREGQIIKMRVESVSQIGIGKCPNSNCITQQDIEAALYPGFSIVIEDGGHIRLVCRYCERHFHREEVI